ncbi:hypothetical protein [Clostridium botulinum]|uniref:hypothetical protein n=1 Tax=Clostridium botulinum TaxID=1491 RepID=UPI0012AE4354|nr:hypothetical protein [Clostridium botulinum]
MRKSRITSHLFRKLIIFTNENYDIIAFSKVKIAIQIKYIQEVMITKLYILNKIIAVVEKTLSKEVVQVSENKNVVEKRGTSNEYIIISNRICRNSNWRYHWLSHS